MMEWERVQCTCAESHAFHAVCVDNRCQYNALPPSGATQLAASECLFPGCAPAPDAVALVDRGRDTEIARLWCGCEFAHQWVERVEQYRDMGRSIPCPVCGSLGRPAPPPTPDRPPPRGPRGPPPPPPGGSSGSASGSAPSPGQPQEPPASGAATRDPWSVGPGEGGSGSGSGTWRGATGPPAARSLSEEARQRVARFTQHGIAGRCSECERGRVAVSWGYPAEFKDLLETGDQRRSRCPECSNEDDNNKYQCMHCAAKVCPQHFCRLDSVGRGRPGRRSLPDMEPVPEDHATGGLKGGAKLSDVGCPSYVPPGWKVKLGDSPLPGCRDPSWGLEDRVEATTLAIARCLADVASTEIRWAAGLAPLLTASKEFHAWRFSREPLAAVERIGMLKEPNPFRPDDVVPHFDPRYPSPYAHPWALAVAVAQGAVPAAWIAVLLGPVPAAWLAALSSHVPAVSTAIALFTGFKAAEVVKEGAEVVKASVSETIAVSSIHVEETIGVMAQETQGFIGLAGMLARGLLVASAILTAAWIVRLLLVGRRTWGSGSALVRAGLRALRRWKFLWPTPFAHAQRVPQGLSQNIAALVARARENSRYHRSSGAAALAPALSSIQGPSGEELAAPSALSSCAERRWGPSAELEAAREFWTGLVGRQVSFFYPRSRDCQRRKFFVVGKLDERDSQLHFHVDEDRPEHQGSRYRVAEIVDLMVEVPRRLSQKTRRGPQHVTRCIDGMVRLACEIGPGSRPAQVARSAQDLLGATSGVETAGKARERRTSGLTPKASAPSPPGAAVATAAFGPSGSQRGPLPQDRRMIQVECTAAEEQWGAASFVCRPDLLPRLLRAILGAHSTIDAAVYVCDSRDLCAALAQRMAPEPDQPACRVRIIVDDGEFFRPSSSEQASALASLAEQGAELRRRRPGPHAFAKQHEKLWIIDGQLLISGSCNATNNSLQRCEENQVYCTVARAVEEAVRHYAELWDLAHPVSQEDFDRIVRRYQPRPRADGRSAASADSAEPTSQRDKPDGAGVTGKARERRTSGLAPGPLAPRTQPPHASASIPPPMPSRIASGRDASLQDRWFSADRDQDRDTDPSRNVGSYRIGGAAARGAAAVSSRATARGRSFASADSSQG